MCGTQIYMLHATYIHTYMSLAYIHVSRLIHDTWMHECVPINRTCTHSTQVYTVWAISFFCFIVVLHTYIICIHIHVMYVPYTCCVCTIRCVCTKVRVCQCQCHVVNHQTSSYGKPPDLCCLAAVAHHNNCFNNPSHCPSTESLIELGRIPKVWPSLGTPSWSKSW